MCLRNLTQCKRYPLNPITLPGENIQNVVPFCCFGPYQYFSTFWTFYLGMVIGLYYYIIPRTLKFLFSGNALVVGPLQIFVDEKRMFLDVFVWLGPSLKLKLVPKGLDKSRTLNSQITTTNKLFYQFQDMHPVEISS